MEHEAHTHTIIGRAMAVQRDLGSGYLESVYKNALAYELGLAGMTVEREKPLQVRYRGVVVGSFCADFIVDGVVLVEAKAVRAIVSAHEAQVVNYLTTTGIDVGLLLNFGAARLEFRRKSRVGPDAVCL